MAATVTLIATASLFCLTACRSDPAPDGVAGGPAAMPDFPPTMQGGDTFAEGKIAVEVTLGLPNFRPGEDRGARSSIGKSGRRRGGMGGGRPESYDGSGEGANSELQPIFGSEGQRMSAMGSNLPPAQLKLRLHNTTSSEPIACEVVDFKSYLGDFAVFPAKYQIAAGETGVSEMMTSRLGYAGGEIAVTVGLQVGGKVERKVVTLRPLPKADPAPDK